MKHKVKEIKLTGGEGRPQWYPRTFATWEGFEHYIQILRAQADADSGYYKLDITIVFDDDEVYQPRYAFQSRPRRGQPDRYVALRDHIAQHNRFYGGIWCPSHMTAEQYAQCLRTIGSDNKQKHLDFLAQYDVE